MRFISVVAPPHAQLNYSGGIVDMGLCNEMEQAFIGRAHAAVEGGIQKKLVWHQGSDGLMSDDGGPDRFAKGGHPRRR